MIQVTPQMRILVAVEPADFRKGIDGLARVCREVLRQDPFSGYVSVFCNRRRQAKKLSRLSLEFDLRPGNRGRLYAAASCLSRNVAIALINKGN